MKSNRFSSAAGLVRILFLVFLLMRLSNDLLCLFPAIITGSFSWQDGYFGWQVARSLIDMAFLGLVFVRFHLIWVAPTTFVWLTTQTVVSMEHMCSSSAGLGQVLLAVLVAFCLALLIGKIFDWCGIRGRILVVCLASAGLPMFYLALALLQQTNLLIENAFFPLARGMIEADIRTLNSAMVEKINHDLPVLLGIAGQASGVETIPLAHEADYWARAESLGIPLKSASEVGLTQGSETLNLEFENIPASSLVDILQKKFAISYDVAGQGRESTKMTLQVKEVNLEEILAQLREIPGLAMRWKNDVLVISPTTDPGTASLRLTLGGEGTANSADFDKLVRWCSGKHLMPAEFYIETGQKEHALTLFIPGRENNRVVRGVILKIDYGRWIDKLLKHEISSGSFQVKVCFPANMENARGVFTGYSTFNENKETRPFELDELAFNNQNSGWSRPLGSLSQPLLPTKEAPLLQDVPAFRNLQILSPRGTEYILESWFLPFCQAPILLSIASDLVWQALLLNQVKSLIYCFLAVLLGGFMSFIYSERLSRPIQEITSAAVAIRDGKLGIRIPAQPGEAEIEELAGALDLMAQRLTGRINLANQELLAEKSRFEILVESTWEGIFLLSREGRLVYANHAARQLIGAMNPDHDFPTMLKAVGTEFLPALPEIWNPDLIEFKTNFQLPCGSQGIRKILTLYIRSISREETQPKNVAMAPGFIAVLRDITVEKEIDRMKSDFVSQVSHELRTPLTSIKAYTEMLLDDEVSDPESRKEYLRITYDEAERLTRLINDLLDIARIESGRRPLKLGEVDLAALTRDISEILGAQMNKSEQILTLHLPSEPVFLIGDADLLKQAGLNLLSNASKYTPHSGKIDIAVERRDDGRLLWKFSDTGIGLSAKDKDRIFNKFFRADSDVVRAAGGTGLGMTLVKNIVDLHQGEILVDSVYEKGSTFTVILPSGITV